MSCFKCKELFSKIFNWLSRITFMSWVRLWGKANLLCVGPRPKGGGCPAWEMFLRDPSPYLGEFQKKPRKTPYDWIEKRNRKLSPACPAYQLWGQTARRLKGLHLWKFSTKMKEIRMFINCSTFEHKIIFKWIGKLQNHNTITCIYILMHEAKLCTSIYENWTDGW